MKKWNDRTLEEKVEKLRRNDIIDAIYELLNSITVILIIFLLSKIVGAVF